VSAVARARRVLGAAYRAAAAPLGLRALDRLLARGLPERLAAPLRFLFDARLPPPSREVRARIEARRRAIAARPDTYGFERVSTPHGPARWLVDRAAAPDGPLVSARRLARNVAVPERWGVFLHLCANASVPGAMLELGSSVGISGAYLAASPSCNRFVTIEGSPAMARVAQETLEVCGTPGTVIRAPFDEGLDRAFAQLDAEGARLTLAYVDGHHDEHATLHYVERLLPRLQPDALVVLDDIYLYPDMWRAWQRVASLPGFTTVLDVGRFAVITWQGSGPPASFDMSRYTGWWRVGRRSRAEAFESPPLCR